MPSSQLQRGAAVMWSIGAVTFTGFVKFARSVTFERSAKKTEFIGNDGDVYAQVFSENKKQFSATIVPSSTTIALAKTAVDGLTIPPGTLIVVTDTSTSGGGMAGNYNLISSRQTRSDSDAVQFEVTLEGPDGGQDFTTAIS